MLLQREPLRTSWSALGVCDLDDVWSHHPRGAVQTYIDPDSGKETSAAERVQKRQTIRTMSISYKLPEELPIQLIEVR
jgi:hypothetical protein